MTTSCQFKKSIPMRQYRAFLKKHIGKQAGTLYVYRVDRRIMALVFVAATVATVTAHFLFSSPGKLWRDHPRELNFADVYGAEGNIGDKFHDRMLPGPSFSSDAQTAPVFARCSQILGRVREVCSDYHLKFVGPTVTTPTEGSISGVRSALHLGNSLFNFSPTSQLIFWQNGELEHHLGYENYLADDVGSQQPWDETKAIEVGTAFLHAILNGNEVRLSEGKAYAYDREFWNPTSPRHKRTWVLWWRRFEP